LVLFPTDTLNRAAVDSLLDRILRGAGWFKTFRLPGTVEAEYAGAGGDAETTANTAFLVNHGCFVHTCLLAGYDGAIVSALKKMSIEWRAQ
jgi:hypothetical protein